MMAVEGIEAQRVIAAASIARQLARLAQLVRTEQTDARESLRSFSEQLFQAAQASREDNIEGLLMLVAQMVTSPFSREAMAAEDDELPEPALAGRLAALLDIVTAIEEGDA